MKPFPLSLTVAVVSLASAFLVPIFSPIHAADPGAPGFEETFDTPALAKGWLVQYFSCSFKFPFPLDSF